MEVKAELKDVTRNLFTQKYQLTFEVEGDVKTALDDITGKMLRLTAVKWREKRSLDSNAYMWLLTDKIAQKLGSTREEIHREQMMKYGIADELDGRPIVIMLSASVDISLIDGYWKFYKSLDMAQGFNYYYRIKRSSEYDTKEMTYFLSHVVEDAKDLGIETATPDELERMKELYEANKKRSH